MLERLTHRGPDDSGAVSVAPSFVARWFISVASTATETWSQSAVVIDNGVNLSGIEWGFGGIWLCSTPNLAFVPDANHDDAPDGEPVIKLDGLHSGYNNVAVLRDVSLTVNELPSPNTVQLSLIEYTLSHTTLGELRIGQSVQIEGDVIGKYARRMMAPYLNAQD